MRDKKIFISPTWGSISLDQVILRMMEYIQDVPRNAYRLIIGTDSLKKNDSVIFVSAIVLHRIGRGGIYFWRRTNHAKIKTLRDRIYKETQSSIDLAYELLSRGKMKNLYRKNEIEIHSDVGENGPTKEMIKEIVGMVAAYGFQPKIKPDACAASNVADRHV